MPRSSGQSAIPSPRYAVAGSPISHDRRAPEPVRLPTMPMMDFMVVVLPAPLRPRQRHQLRPRDRESRAQCKARAIRHNQLAGSRQQRMTVGQACPTPNIGFRTAVMSRRGVIAFKPIPGRG